MGLQWFWVIRLLGALMLTPVRVSRGRGFFRRGRLAITTAALAWTALWLNATFLLVWSMYGHNSLNCFQDIIYKTMRVYNASNAVTTVVVLAYLTSALCLVKLYRRDLVGIINQSVNLHAKAARDLTVMAFALTSTLKAFIVFLYLYPIVEVNIITVLCVGNDSIPWESIFMNCLDCILNLPAFGMVTVFFVLLHTSDESLALIHKQLLNLYASMTPRHFLEIQPSPSPSPGTKPRAPLTVQRLHALRMIHYELVQFIEDAVKQFQSDILLFLVTSYCLNVMQIYSIVFNHRDLFRDRKTFYFVCHSTFLTVNVVSCLWMICVGPTRIKDKRRDLVNITARLSTITNQPSDTLYEIRIFQLQVSNLTPSFEVFGMFEINFSLLFMMCASIISYIVVLIQFAVPPPDSV